MGLLAHLEFESNVKPEQRLENAEIDGFHQEIPEWVVETVEEEKRLTRQFKFKDFKSALDFVQKVGQLAESFDHHPLISLEWGKASVAWWTHSIAGLHANDFLLAYKTEKIYEQGRA